MVSSVSRMSTLSVNSSVRRARVEARGRQRGRHLGDEVRLLDLAGTDVDVDHDRASPLPRPRHATWRHDCLEHPAAELDDQAGLFGERDEIGRVDDAAFGMLPAQQRLDTCQGARR